MDRWFEERAGIYRGWLHPRTQKIKKWCTRDSVISIIICANDSHKIHRTLTAGQRGCYFSATPPGGHKVRFMWQLAGAAYPHLVKEDPRLTSNILGDHPSPMPIVVLLVFVNWEIHNDKNQLGIINTLKWTYTPLIPAVPCQFSRYRFLVPNSFHSCSHIWTGCFKQFSFICEALPGTALEEDTIFSSWFYCALCCFFLFLLHDWSVLPCAWASSGTLSLPHAQSPSATIQPWPATVTTFIQLSNVGTACSSLLSTDMAQLPLSTPSVHPPPSSACLVP